MRGSGVSKLSKESIVEVVRAAEGRTYNFGHMHVPKHRVETPGTHRAVENGLNRTTCLEPVAGCSAQVACKE